MAGGGYLVAALWLFPAPLLPNERAVARVTGLGEADARRDLMRQGLAVTVQREPHATAPVGTVFWQDPPAGVAVPRGSGVTITVSSGFTRIAVPDVAGLGHEMAIRLLVAAGLRIDGTDSLETPGTAPGIAVATAPAAGDSVIPGRGVLLRLAR